MDQDQDAQGREIVISDLTTMVERMVDILQGVDSLLDVTSDHIEQLNQLTDGPLIISKFQTSLEEFDHWSSTAGKGIKDVGLDENYDYLVIRWRYVWAIEGIGNFKVSDEATRFKRMLNSTSKSYYIAVRSKSSSLDNGIDAPQQEFDRILSEYYSVRAPAVAIELAYSNSPASLRQGSTHVLRGVENVKKFIIMLRIFPQSSQRTSPEDNWDLTETEIQEMSPDDLCQHAINWYHERGIYLSEEFHLTVHRWNGVEYRKGSTEVHFRHNERINLTLTPNIFFKTKRRLPNGESELVQLEFPLRKLVAELRERWLQAEYNRIAECVALKQGRRHIE